MIFFDLDGPILDVSDKYYQVYSDILKAEGYQVLSKEDYWAAKRAKIPDQEILARTSAEKMMNSFQNKRNHLIETPPYQKWDRLQDNALNALDSLIESYKLILVTLRRSIDELENELAYFGLERLFQTVLCDGTDIKPRWTIKRRLIVEYLKNYSSNGHWIIGDTETDILAGKMLGLTTVAVTNGIRTKEYLQQAEPDYIIPSIANLMLIIDKK